MDTRNIYNFKLLKIFTLEYPNIILAIFLL